MSPRLCSCPQSTGVATLFCTEGCKGAAAAVGAVTGVGIALAFRTDNGRAETGTTAEIAGFAGEGFITGATFFSGELGCSFFAVTSFACPVGATGSVAAFDGAAGGIFPCKMGVVFSGGNAGTFGIDRSVR